MYEANSIIKFIGSGLVMMGILYCTGLILLNEWQITCYSLSAFAFVASDIFDFALEPYDKKLFNNILVAGKIKRLNKAKAISYFIAISFITWIPFVHTPSSQESIVTLSNTVLLIGLGATIILIGFRMDKKVTRDINLWIKLHTKKKPIEDDDEYDEEM
ncbi:hypothetical protein ACIFOT_14170 [Neobacillus sp. NRS-1170]|uniref:hypothetical protein n=1 Tax=Neobacillus sp. NRS-1170 TaxID=3233898 RepID=UPI003D280C74